MEESDLNAPVIKGDNENTKATEGKFSICQGSRKGKIPEAGGPQKTFVGEEVKECTDFLHIPEAT